MLECGVAGTVPICEFGRAESRVLSCACWCGGASGGAWRLVAAGFDDGAVVMYSMLNPSQPNVTLRVNPYASADAARRPLRALRWAGGPAGKPALYATGGTAVELDDPDGVVLLHGEGLRERAVVGVAGVLDSCVTNMRGGGATLDNGAAAAPDALLLLSAAGELHHHNLRALADAPVVFPRMRARHVAVGEAVATASVRVGASGGARVHLFVTAAATLDALPERAFFDDNAPVCAEAAARADGSSGEGSWSRGLRWISQSILGAENDDGVERVEAELRAALFPDAPSGAAASTAEQSGGVRGAAAPTADEARAALLGGDSAVGGASAGASDGDARKRERAVELHGASRAACSSMGESVVLAAERGERLRELGDKSERMAHASSDFLSMARALRQQEERGIWGRLFG